MAPSAGLHGLVRPDRYPRSSGYDPHWVRGLDMGPHPLWQLEDLLPQLDLRPGQRVLDLGCGRGATSVFLARELGVEVLAVDLWVPEHEVRDVVAAAGVGELVQVVNADVRRTGLGEETVDAVVSIDAFEYFGTDTRLLPELPPVLRPGGRITMSTPALAADPYDHDPPAALLALLGGEVAGWHAPAWWRRHWELSGLLSDVTATMQPGSREDWIRWQRLVAGPDDALLPVLTTMGPGEIGFALVGGTRVDGFE